MNDLQDSIRLIQSHDALLAEKLAVEGDCIIYTGYRNYDGYGKVGRSGRAHFAHRYVFALLFGEVVSDLKVLHRCDNPPCCNPSHLFLGTQHDNIRDMFAKGRARRAPQRGRPGLKGEDNPKAKLTKRQVAWIRRHYSPVYGSPFGTARLAQKFSVGRNTILDVVRGKTWRVA